MCKVKIHNYEDKVLGNLFSIILYFINVKSNSIYNIYEIIPCIFYLYFYKMMPITKSEKESSISLLTVFKTLYKDPFKWSIIKSISFALTAVYIARECRGLELMPSA